MLIVTTITAIIIIALFITAVLFDSADAAGCGFEIDETANDNASGTKQADPNTTGAVEWAVKNDKQHKFNPHAALKHRVKTFLL